MWYYGTIFNELPLYHLEIERSKQLSLNYIIPKNSIIFPIITQQTDS